MLNNPIITYKLTLNKRLLNRIQLVRALRALKGGFRNHLLAVSVKKLTWTPFQFTCPLTARASRFSRPEVWLRGYNLLKRNKFTPTTHAHTTKYRFHSHKTQIPRRKWIISKKILLLTRMAFRQWSKRYVNRLSLQIHKLDIRSQKRAQIQNSELEEMRRNAGDFLNLVKTKFIRQISRSSLHYFQLPFSELNSEDVGDEVVYNKVSKLFTHNEKFVVNGRPLELTLSHLRWLEVALTTSPLFTFLLKTGTNSTWTNFSNIATTNLLPNFPLKTRILRKMAMAVSLQRFKPAVGGWFSTSLIRFLENCTGFKALVKIQFFLLSSLSPLETTRCLIWSSRLTHFKRSIGLGLYLLESVQVSYLALKTRDPYIFINWMAATLRRISFWKHRLFFHFLRYLFRHFFFAIFHELHFRGVKFKLKGKISVAGNSRTRTICYSIGVTSQTSLENRILQTSSLVRTFTGVMGLQVWFVF